MPYKGAPADMFVKSGRRNKGHFSLHEADRRTLVTQKDAWAIGQSNGIVEGNLWDKGCVE